MVDNPDGRHVYATVTAKQQLDHNIDTVATRKTHQQQLAWCLCIIVFPGHGTITWWLRNVDINMVSLQVHSGSTSARQVLKLAMA
ncbi:hypothetical protein C5167_003799 [Papaver somniferum]|uniref:Uncharacterized protein n=1 Tax=Papaver somniferum TaxID=3469 RepID=A0A4Y7L315_PAPSO|nr:hypothetical protein C5167_003799 [Papaver somniferum]